MFFGLISNKKSSYNIGIVTENYVKSYLLKKGYKILSSRWRYNNKKGTGLGEIDIITKRENTITFIEVKARNNIDNLFYSISPIQQKRIINSAIVFMSKQQQYINYNMQFDAIFVLISNKQKEITHIENAFDASNIQSMIGL